MLILLFIKVISPNCKNRENTEKYFFKLHTTILEILVVLPRQEYVKVYFSVYYMVIVGILCSTCK